MVDALQDHHEVGLVSWRCHCILSEESGLSECETSGMFFCCYRNEEWNCQITVNNGTLRHPYIVMMPTQLWHQ